MVKPLVLTVILAVLVPLGLRQVVLQTAETRRTGIPAEATVVDIQAMYPKIGPHKPSEARYFVKLAWTHAGVTHEESTGGSEMRPDYTIGQKIPITLDAADPSRFVAGQGPMAPWSPWAYAVISAVILLVGGSVAFFSR